MRAERGLGYLPDDPAIVTRELVERHISNLVGALSPTRPPALDYTQFVEKIPDQQNTSSCVGQAFATATHITANLAGMRIPRPSAKAIYDFARLEDRPYTMLEDDGSRPLAAIRCLVEKGMVSDTDWPLVFDVNGRSNVNAMPPLDVYQEALAARVGDWYRIAAGAGASALVRHALARGLCPVFAMPVDEQYQWWSTGAVYEGRVGKSLGLHMQALAGYGDGHLLVVSSWGATHGARGVVKLAADYFDSGECTDIIVCRVVPPLTP